ncbi:Pycsar system effector family protein [Streptomyces thermodiastaticus]|uniref:Pycsar system effector family protein n=1 Tax=Streptomyces thermodiastaticus TaxID=44061 RepID=UPI0016799FA7|nr:Pycsar system effector family protein [Streptomyces thermodiastaticus]MCE7551286.1 DUF5706 domain-containing protein [Streptomyces thermodiastaticus]GHF97408.1 hypothetical protein GCM10018787_52420 [Streptomyces thermodiastaticus]
MSEQPRVTQEDATRHAWQLQGTLAESTRTADAKASFALAIESAMLAAMVTLAGSEHGLGRISGALARTVLWTGVALLAVSVVLAVLAVLPRHDREGRRRPVHQDDFVFYGHIRHLTAAELEESLRGHDPLPALSRQIVAMSRILWIKQRLVRQSLLIAVGGGVLIAVGALTG